MGLLTDLLGDGYATSGLALGHGVPYTVDPGNVTNLSQTINANRAVYMRAIGSGPITKIGMHIGTSSGNICVGVYSSTGSGRAAVPGARKATSGSVACPAAGFASVSLGGSVDVEEGDWLAIVPDNATAAFASSGALLIATNLWAGRAAFQDTAFPLPATAASTAGLIKGPCLVGVA